MTTILYGNTWIGDDAPSTGVLPCQQWIKPTSGEIFYRDTTNAIWTPFGNVNNNLGGAVSVAGDTMTGPLLDAPNIPPLDSPDFLGTIDQAGFPVALKVDLAAMNKRINDQISSQVRSQFLSQFQQSATAANIAFYCRQEKVPNATLAIGGTGFQIPMPIFKSDNATATKDQLLGYGWANCGFGGTSTDSGSWWDLWESTSGAGASTTTPTPGSMLLKVPQNAFGAGQGWVFLLYWALASR